MRWRNKILKGIVQENMSDGNEGFSSEEDEGIQTRALNSRNDKPEKADKIESHRSVTEGSQGRTRHKRGTPFGMSLF